MDKIYISGSEVQKIYSIAGQQINVPMIDEESSTAQVLTVDLDGYEFPAIAVSLPGREEAEMLINLNTQLVLELVPTTPYQTDTDLTQIQKAALEDLLQKTDA